ncbi:MAG: hypothetical protein OWV35_06960 [Firmicutes bacterium]|nr:hypothetical protein [Bacillota bacterium]
MAMVIYLAALATILLPLFGLVTFGVWLVGVLSLGLMQVAGELVKALPRVAGGPVTEGLGELGSWPLLGLAYVGAWALAPVVPAHPLPAGWRGVLMTVNQWALAPWGAAPTHSLGSWIGNAFRIQVDLVGVYLTLLLGWAGLGAVEARIRRGLGLPRYQPRPAPVTERDRAAAYWRWDRARRAVETLPPDAPQAERERRIVAMQAAERAYREAAHAVDH